MLTTEMQSAAGIAILSLCLPAAIYLVSPVAYGAVLPDFALAMRIPKGSSSQQPCPGTALPLRSV